MADAVIEQLNKAPGNFIEAAKIVLFNDADARKKALEDAHKQQNLVSLIDSAVSVGEKYIPKAFVVAGAALATIPLAARGSFTMARTADATIFNHRQGSRGQKPGTVFAMKMIADINKYSTADLKNPDFEYAAGNIILDTSDFFNPDGTLTPAGEQVKRDALASGNPEEFLLNHARTLVKVAFEKWAKKYKEYAESRSSSEATFADRHIDRLRKIFEDKSAYNGLSSNALNAAVFSIYKQFTAVIDTRAEHAAIPQIMLDAYNDLGRDEKPLARVLDASLASSVKAKDGNKVVMGFKGLTGSARDGLPVGTQIFLSANPPVNNALTSLIPEVEIPMGETDVIAGNSIQSIRKKLGLIRKPDGTWDLKVDPTHPPRETMEKLIESLITSFQTDPKFAEWGKFVKNMPKGLEPIFMATLRWQLFYSLLGVLDPADMIKNKFLGLASKRQQGKALTQTVAADEGAKIKVGDDAVVFLVPDDTKKHYNPMAKALKDIKDISNTDPGKLAEFLGVEMTAVYPGSGIQLLVKRYKDRKEAIVKIRNRYEDLKSSGQDVSGLLKFLDNAEPKSREIFERLLAMLLAKYAEKSGTGVTTDQLTQLMGKLVTPTLKGEDLTKSTEWDELYEGVRVMKLLGITEEKTEAAALSEMSSIPAKLIVTFTNKPGNDDQLFGFTNNNSRTQNKTNLLDVINAKESTPRDLYFAVKLYDELMPLSNRAVLDELLKLVKRIGADPVFAASGATQLRLLQLMQSLGFISRNQTKFIESNLIDRKQLFGEVKAKVIDVYNQNQNLNAQYKDLRPFLFSLGLTERNEDRGKINNLMKDKGNQAAVKSSFAAMRVDVSKIRQSIDEIRMLNTQVSEVINMFSVFTLTPAEELALQDLRNQLAVLQNWNSWLNQGMLLGQAIKP